MKLTKVVALAAFALVAPAAANAAPVSGLGTAPAVKDGALIKVHGVHRSCELGKYGWHRSPPGGGRIECRPHRPRGEFWIWRSEGGRHGWWHRHEKRWH